MLFEHWRRARVLSHNRTGPGLPAGTYVVVCGSDIDGDGQIDGDGDFFGHTLRRPTKWNMLGAFPAAAIVAARADR